MALDIGELVGYVGLETGPFDKGLDKVGEKLRSWGKSKGAKIAAGVGIAIGTAIGASLAGAMDLEKAQSKLNAQLGAKGVQAKRLGSVAGKVYADAFGESMEDVNEAIAQVVQNIDGMRDASKESLTAISEGVIAVSGTFDQDFRRTTRAVSAMLRNGLAPNAQSALDILTKGFQNGVNSADDLLDTFTEYPVEMRKLGISGAQAMGLLSQGLKGGARDSDKVADALKEFSIRAVDGSVTTQTGFEQIGLSASKMASQVAAGGKTANDALALVLDRLRAIPDPVKRSQAAVNLFGTQAEDLGQALYALDPRTAVAAIGDVTGAAKELGDTLHDNASTKIEQWKRKAKLAFINLLGGKILPVIEDFAKHTGPLLPMLLGLAGAALAVAAAVKTWAAIQAVLNTVLTANPILLTVAAVAALTAAIIYAYQHSETFREIVQAAFDLVGEAVQGVVDVAKTVFGWLRDHWPLLLAILTGPFGLAVKFIVDHWGGIVSFFAGLPEKLGALGKAIVDAITWPFKAAFNLVAKLWNNTLGGFTVGGFLGLPSFTLPTMPIVPMAKGAVVSSPTLAMIGEGREKEAVAPLSTLHAMIADAVRGGDGAAMPGGLDRLADAMYALAERPLVLAVDGTEIARVVDRGTRVLARRA